MVGIGNTGPERRRRVNRSGCPTGAEGNNGDIIDDLGEITGVALWLLDQLFISL